MDLDNLGDIKQMKNAIAEYIGDDSYKANKIWGSYEQELESRGINVDDEKGDEEEEKSG